MGKRFSTAFGTCIGTQIGGMICVFALAKVEASPGFPGNARFMGFVSEALGHIGIDGVEPDIVLVMLPAFIGFILGTIYTFRTWNRVDDPIH